MLELLIADLANDLPGALRLQRMVQVVAQHFACDAVGLLQLDATILRIVAAAGLSNETMGRHFTVSEHPRFATILQGRDPTHFEPDSTLPDPYDGLLDDKQGMPLPVHDCMGISLYVKNKCWGILTLDALEPGKFGNIALLELQRCSLILESAIRVNELEMENRSLRLLGSPMNTQHPPSIQHELLGQSPALLSALNELDTVAPAHLPVLLLGETGVGKELFARRLHQNSTRWQQALLQVNCAALPDSLAESELFGHVRGAFSGAVQDRAGRVEAAQGGTLLLDEIGELSLHIQAKLLRVLQNGEVQRLGADRPIKVDVRIIAATNRDLQQQIQEGSFRADLFHRLSVYPLRIPPLRERSADILLLAGHFLEANRSRLGLRGIRLSPAAEHALLHYSWPGNVRELEHVISRAAIKLLVKYKEKNQIFTLEKDDLGLELSTSRPIQHSPAECPHKQTVTWQPLRSSIEQFQKERILHALQHTQGNWSQAAQLLQLDASNLRKLAQKLGLKLSAKTSH